MSSVWSHSSSLEVERKAKGCYLCFYCSGLKFLVNYFRLKTWYYDKLIGFLLLHFNFYFEASNKPPVFLVLFKRTCTHVHTHTFHNNPIVVSAGFVLTMYPLGLGSTNLHLINSDSL